VKVIGIVGRKDSGKTHLVVRLIGEFALRGFTVSTIKHTHHHDFVVDQPGKDSDRHRVAGAREVILAGDRQWALIHSAAAPPTIEELLGRLAPCDIVLVEGYKGLSQLTRIEVCRDATTRPPLALGDPQIVAVACPSDCRLPEGGLLPPRLDLNDTSAIARFILER
jgi:molybdopterin-guanine dinucleotide biosynthesis protein MobB